MLSGDVNVQCDGCWSVVDTAVGGIPTATGLGMAETDTQMIDNATTAAGFRATTGRETTVSVTVIVGTGRETLVNDQSMKPTGRE